MEGKEKKVHFTQGEMFRKTQEVFPLLESDFKVGLYQQEEK